MTIDTYLQQPFDCLILVHPQIQVLERVSHEIQRPGVAHLNLSKLLSAALLPVFAGERGRFSQKWLLDTLAALPSGDLVCCTSPDLLFEPSLQIDPLSLFRQAARVSRGIVLWPGEYTGDTLSYAVPEHHHFRTWKVTADFLRQPAVIIQALSTSQGV